MDDQFEEFAKNFVKIYWEAAQSQSFTLPPEDEITRKEDELFDDISFRTIEMTFPNRLAYQLVMKNSLGDQWDFAFDQSSGRKWTLTGAIYGNVNHVPLDLLGEVYSDYFLPFLNHVTDMANRKTV